MRAGQTAGPRCPLIPRYSRPRPPAAPRPADRPPRSLQRQRLKMDGQLGECTRFAHELGLSLVHRDRFVMPHSRPHTADMPTPPHNVLDRQLHHVVGSALKDRHRGRVPVGNQEGEGVDHQVEWMRVRRQRREGSDRPGHLDKDVGSAEMVRCDGGTPCGQVGPASEAEVEPLEPLRSSKEQRRRLIAIARHGGSVTSRSAARACWNPSSAPLCAVARSRCVASNSPAWKLASAAANARPAWRVGSGVSAVARSRRPRRRRGRPVLGARPALRSKSDRHGFVRSAAAGPRCHARLSAGPGIAASASASSP